MSRLKHAFVGALLSVAVPGIAMAQTHSSCVIPEALPQPRIPDPRQQQPQNIKINGYLLALSWSPEFCRGRQSQKRHHMQCSGEAGQFSFVLHGLWPNAPGRQDPRWCRPVALPPPTVLRSHLCRTPSVDLLAHEWAKHGSCGFVDSERYFRAAGYMYDALRFPDLRRLSRKNPDVNAVKQAFAALNPELQPNAIAVITNRRQWLEEIRLCLGRDFRPRSCAPEDRGAGDKQPVKIWRGD